MNLHIYKRKQHGGSKPRVGEIIETQQITKRAFGSSQGKGMESRKRKKGKEMENPLIAQLIW